MCAQIWESFLTFGWAFLSCSHWACEETTCVTCSQAAMEAPGAQHADVEAMARAVANHAQKQHTKDDVSVVLIMFTASAF